MCDEQKREHPRLRTTARERLDFRIEFCLKKIMDERGLSIADVTRESGLRYETIKSYYYDEISMVDKYVKAVLCVTLDCDLADLEMIVYDEIRANGKHKITRQEEKI